MPISGILATVLSALLMGTMGVFSKFTGLSAETMTCGRLFFGAGFMLFFLVGIGRTGCLRQWPSWPVLVNGAMLSGFIIFYVQAMTLTTMANAIMLVYLAPVSASVVAHFFLGERLDRVRVILIGGALLGFAMMMEFQLELSTGSGHLLGIGYGLLSMAAYTSFILLNRLVRPEIHLYSRTFYQLLVGGLVVLPLVALDPPSISGVNWLWLLATGLLPGFLAILCAVIGLHHLPAATFGTLAYVEPVAVVVFGWVLFQERLSPLQLGGCGLILLCGIVQVCYRPSRPSRPREAVPAGT
ncbi:DMT family transporter [Desulfogranum mediterraneum]|uniref:DMT family transporter n=1 Tax=Desulfogranum mediterraneum TaxID=160661 RepID=UPI000428CDE2|nr:DMT family transporter [Desulfogranum mediterraneum]